MSQRVYIDFIFKPVVKRWLAAGEDCMLEVDGDSGNRLGKSNLVRDWKDEQNLKYYFNCAQSPDLSRIENC